MLQACYYVTFGTSTSLAYYSHRNNKTFIIFSHTQVRCTVYSNLKTTHINKPLCTIIFFGTTCHKSLNNLFDLLRKSWQLLEGAFLL